MTCEEPTTITEEEQEQEQEEEVPIKVETESTIGVDDVDRGRDTPASDTGRYLYVFEVPICLSVHLFANLIFCFILF